MKRFLLILLTALWVASCEIPFPLEQKGEPRLYLQCIPQDTVVALTVQYAAPVGADAPKNFRPSDISLLVNGEKLAVSDRKETHDFFTARIDLEEGDEVSVSVSGEGLHEASGHTAVPAAPNILDFTWEEAQVDSIDATAVHFKLDHAPSENEYYGIQIINYCEITYLDGSKNTLVSYLTPGYVLTLADSMGFDLEDFMQVNYYDFHLGGNQQWQPITLVTRKQFTEDVYDFYLNSFDSSILDTIRERMPDGETGMAGGGIVSGEVGPVPGGGKLTPDQIPVKMVNNYYFYFARLSPEFYHYAKTLYQSNFDFLSNMGLTPANFTWTNVEGGLGMVGALSGVQLGRITKEVVPKLPQ